MNPVRSVMHRLGHVTSVSLSVAWAFGLALVVGAFVAPVYHSEGSSSSGATTHGSATLVGENGVGVGLIAGLPLVVALLVGGALCVRSARAGITMAWAITGVLVVFNVLALLSIGIFVIPVTGALVVACSNYPRPPTRATRAHIIA